jgi:hypothetical protein
LFSAGTEIKFIVGWQAQKYKKAMENDEELLGNDL